MHMCVFVCVCREREREGEKNRSTRTCTHIIDIIGKINTAPLLSPLKGLGSAYSPTTGEVEHRHSRVYRKFGCNERW